METVNKENLLEELKNLKVGETLFVSIDKDVSNAIQLLFIKVQSYRSLFSSYINNTVQEANKLNLDAFLEKYAKANQEIEILKSNMLKKYLDEAYEYFITNNFFYNFNYELDVLQIKKLGGNKINDAT
ncbi:MAG: hypothetical protein LKF87_03720 [Clostridium tyrobutyricum]|jgi:hypothetical protein|uniref:hypothetical protein n=1 Tax=Clostridium tyrobutyricum TaxID=1519 RepID=UPI00242C39F6|nr:hypothetical protein [Clostridium tyrobutyricum]MCH4199289.1 hypothetical protein [Clostridium tyrobutyricum]MCH4236621.1 hypothetical protein [Clostridium tyrobutyricum]MCH4258063.1 hypothetical protein [Clostridium tyrobutyricum]MCI1239102.1 hypothetical protein [Clostridium tyrobutyricum]MCI1651426.1 hypothetical protein [Clostridium tyrobutyricum]